MSKALIIFARQPVPGLVKTRLARDVGDETAAQIYRAMLEDTLGVAGGLDEARRMIFWASGADAHSGDIGDCRFEQFTQAGADLGARMAAAFAQAFETGARHCCIIGSDSPGLPPEFIEQAFAMLQRDEADVVFGPCDDGGYYLLGMNRLYPLLFEDIAWSTPLVLETSMRRTRDAGLRFALLPGWYDVDTLADLRRLARDGGMGTATWKMAVDIVGGDTEMETEQP